MLLLLITDLLLLLQLELLRLLALTLLLLIAELYHRLGLLRNGWISGWHNNLCRGHRWFCGLREPLLLGHRDIVHALLVLLLAQ